jgi:FkbM family methyltransferase
VPVDARQRLPSPALHGATRQLSEPEVKVLSKLRRATELFRTAYGNARGTLLWLELLKEKFVRPGGLFAVHVPGAPAPVWLRAHSSDVEVFCQIFGHREMDFYHNAEARYIIDAGANIGLTSVFLANRCPLARIDALEVDPQNIDLLRRNVAAYAQVNVIPRGLWRRSGYIKILNPDAQSWAFRVGETSDDDESRIPAVAVADLLRDRGAVTVDLLKIDIEGAEVDILDDSAKVWLGAVKVLAIELHDRMRAGCSAALDGVAATRPHRRSVSGEYHVLSFAD